MDSELSLKFDHGTKIDEDEKHDKAPYIGRVEIIPEVRKCDLLHFKNHFDAAVEGLYAVDVLESDSFLDQEEIEEECRLRQSLPKIRVKPTGMFSKPTSKTLTQGKGVQSISKPIETFRTGKPDTKIISRIRIRSPAILSTLSKIMQESWGTRPRTFIRPFRPLLYFHTQVVESLRDLEVERGQEENGSESVRNPNSMTGASEQVSGDDKVSVDDSTSALAELKCYVQFMSDEILPLCSQFENLDENSNAKVRFDDLTYLFQVGQVVYRAVGGGEIQESNNFTLGQRAWRIYEHGTLPFSPWNKLSSAHSQNYSGEIDGEKASFEVDCYYIDYTGEEFCVVTQKFKIHPYEGERPINSLKVFPSRFLKDHKERLEMYTLYGRKFLSCIGEGRHAAYNWWTVIRTPKGDPITNTDGSDVKRAEYVDSEVIIDFVEAFQTYPSWKPEPSILKAEEPRRLTILDNFYTCWWSDSNRTKLLAETTETIVLRAGIRTHERNQNLQDDKFLATIRENDKSNRQTTAKHLRDCDMALLPSRVFGYVLRDRKFVQMDVHGLSPVTESSDGFDCLKINHSHSHLIKSLVEDHFMKKISDRKDGVKRTYLDWVEGKGKGLYILLHGAPGVGKTATAEAVARASGKPLFAITCGDLGLTPTEVESALRRIFRLANTWDCVLLLDEVDTFVSQRSKGDVNLNKNAIVSVFLRVMEYYDGLLFLTTNRPGALDEAFKSRIHLSLYYPPLSLQQTMDIWKMNIDRMRKIEEERCKDPGLQPLQISEQEILRLAEERYRGRFRWNGRQIRNAIQIASSLAHSDARKDKILPRLTKEHFEMIYVVTEDFDAFMQETVGKSDGALAFERGDRADHWEPEQARAGDDKSHAYDSASSPRGGHSGRGSVFRHRQPSIVGRHTSNYFDGNQDKQVSCLGQHPQSSNCAKHRASWEIPPSIFFNEGAESDSARRARGPRMEHLQQQGLDEGYHDGVGGGVSPDSTNGLDKNVLRRIGNVGRPKHGLDDLESERQLMFKRRKEHE